MKKYIIKRLLALIPTLFVVSVVIFSIIHMTPGDPAAMILGDKADAAAVEALRESMGLNDPLPVQYVNWVSRVLRGNPGRSVFIDKPMTEILKDYMGPTFALTVYAMLLATALAIPLGVLAAKHRGTMADQGISFVSMVGISMPSFLLGLLLILGFAVKLQWFPVGGYKEFGSVGFFVYIRYLTLPALALGFMEAALIIRLTRASVLEVLASDYVKMAKAKGVSEFALVMKHAFKNALIPILTVLGQTFMALLAGAAVVESVFNIPGIGRLTVNSVARRDYEVIQAVVLLVSLINVVMCLAVDLLYGLVDPRVRLED
ncbi:MAG: ABC transporter permease [Lachnospiraceae bacterium]|nr:ABC transporter permease [Lachnospiraceae bacterium]